MIAVSAGVEPSGSLVWLVRESGMNSGATTDKISSMLVTGVAPCLISALQPALCGLVMLPGTTKTSLP